MRQPSRVVRARLQKHFSFRPGQGSWNDSYVQQPRQLSPETRRRRRWSQRKPNQAFLRLQVRFQQHSLLPAPDTRQLHELEPDRLAVQLVQVFEHSVWKRMKRLFPRDSYFRLNSSAPKSDNSGLNKRAPGYMREPGSIRFLVGR